MPEHKIDINEIVTAGSNRAFDEILLSKTALFKFTLEDIVKSIEESDLFVADMHFADLSFLKQEELANDIPTASKLAAILVKLGKTCLKDYDLIGTDRPSLLMWCFRVTKLFDAYVEIMVSVGKQLDNVKDDLVE